MDVVYAQGEVSADDVITALPDPPSRTSVRTFLRILEEKGHLAHTKRGRHYIYKSTNSRQSAGQWAIRRVLNTFFDGCMDRAVAAYMCDPDAEISPEELHRLAKLIEQAQCAENQS